MVNKQDDTSKAELQKLGRRIRELRKAKGYSSHETFAYEHDLSRTVYGQWERGANITYLNLLRLCGIFGVTVKEFFSEGFEEGK